jgi:hypothetical protein
MAIYEIIWQMLAWSVTVALLLPVMFPWARVAYKVWHGNTPIDEDLADELWMRCLYASGALFLATPIFLCLDYVSASPDWAGIPPGPVHVVFYLAFLATAGVIMHYCFSMEDFFGGLSMAVIYLYIPAAIFYVLSLLIKNPLLDYVCTWLVQPKDL